MTKSEMRVYKDNDYSDLTVYLDMTVRLDDSVGLWIDTPNESIRLDADDVLLTLNPYIHDLIKAALQNEH